MFFCAEVGMAHIVRPLALADELHKRGYEIFFTLSKRKWKDFPNNNFNYIDIQQCINSDSIEVIKIFHNKNKIVKMIEEELVLIKKYKPDIIVIDLRPSTFISSFLVNIPTYVISSGYTIPYPVYIPNVFWTNYEIHKKFQFFYSKLVLRVISRHTIDFLVKIGYYFDKKITKRNVIKFFNYIVAHDNQFLPSIHENKNVYYVGHMRWNGFIDLPLNLVKNNKKTVYLSFGGTGFSKERLISIASYLINKGLQVIVSTGTIANISDFPKHKLLYVNKYFNTHEVLKNVDIVICHGGLGTILEATIAEKPVLFIPFNPDQYINAIRYKELGLGKYIPINIFKFILYSLTFNWKSLERLSEQISVETIYKQIKEIIKNYPSYVQAIKKYNENSLKDKGAENAADLICEFLDKHSTIDSSVNHSNPNSVIIGR